jgi:hypothetical protein
LAPTENPCIIGGGEASEAMTSFPPEPIDHPPRHHQHLINFNSDQRLTDNSLTLLQHGGILALGIDHQGL